MTKLFSEDSGVLFEMYGKNNERISAVCDIVFHFMRIYDVGRRVGETQR